MNQKGRRLSEADIDNMLQAKQGQMPKPGFLSIFGLLIGIVMVYGRRIFGAGLVKKSLGGEQIETLTRKESSEAVLAQAAGVGKPAGNRTLEAERDKS